MFTGNKENSADSRANQPAQKSPKEKTMAGGPVNRQGYIDITKPLTQQERALLNQRMQDLHGETNPAKGQSDFFDDYYPGKYSENKFVEIDAAKNGYISSYVGNCTSNPEKGIVANLGKDVFYVQKHLNRLGILSDKDYANEKPPTGKEISKSTIPATIEAIGFYQERILHKAKASVDKEVWPGYGTIKSLATITLTESRIKHFEFIKKSIRTRYEEAKEKLAAEREAEIERIKNEPATNENVSKLYQQFDEVEEFGKALKDYAIYNPQFVLKAIELTDFGEPDNLTRAIMHNLSDAEIEQLPQALDTKFYEALDAGWTVDEEYELMKKLKKGRGVVAEKMTDRKASAIEWKSYLQRENVKIEDEKLLKRISKNRDDVTDYSKKLISYRKGYFYGGSEKGTPSNKNSNKAQIAVWNELFSEGGYESINTWDGEIFTWGLGFAAKGLLPAVLENIFNDDTIKSKFENLGITLVNKNIFVVDTISGNILSGMKGYNYIAKSDKLLHFFISLGNEKNDRQKIIDAQYSVIMSTVGKIPDFIIDTKLNKYKGGWNDNAVKLAAHLGHWLTAGGWDLGKDLYKSSNGDILKIIQAFCLTLHRKTKIVNLNNERYIWEVLKYTAVAHLNLNGFAGGIGMRAIKKECATPIEAKKAETLDKYKNHILLPIEKAKKYYVIKKTI